MEATRTSGVALNEQRFEEGVISLAVPVFDISGVASCAIAIAVPQSRFDDVTRIRLTRQLRKAGTTLSSELGGQIPDSLLQLWRNAS